MNKQELIRAVAEDTTMPLNEVEFILNSFFREVESQMIKGETLQIKGFGTFSVNKHKKKKVMDFQHNRQYAIPARSVPRFKFCKRIVQDVVDEN